MNVESVESKSEYDLKECQTLFKVEKDADRE